MIKQYYRSWGVTAATNAFVLICGLVTGVIAARLLQPEGRGEMAAILLWPHLIAWLGITGLHEAVTFFVSKKKASADVITATAFWMAIVLSIVTAAAGYAVLPYLLGSDRVLLLDVAQVYLLAYVPVHILMLSIIATDHGRQEFIKYNLLLRVIPPFLYLIGLAVLWVAGFVSVELFVLMSWVGIAAATAMRLLLVGKGLVNKPSIKEAKNLLVTGASFHITSVIVIFGAQIDRIYVMFQWGDVELGYYVVACMIATVALNVVTNTFHTVMYPKLSAMNSLREQKELFGKGLRFASLLLIAGCVVLTLIIPWAVKAIFGSAYDDAISIAVVLTIAYVPYGLRQIIIKGLRGLGDAKQSALGEGVAVALFILIVWPIASRLGLFGVGVALLIANSMAIIYLSLYLKKRLGLAFREWCGLNRSTIVEVYQLARHGG